MRGAAHFDGAVAQLGERLLCKQEVIGSIPFTSTSFPETICKPKVYIWFLKPVRLFAL